MLWTIVSVIGPDIQYEFAGTNGDCSFPGGITHMKLGFLGLGIMGYPMARNLIRAGNSVVVWSNTIEKARKLAAEEHAELCETPRKVAEVADIIFVCVGDTAMSEEVALGAGGLLEGIRTGAIVADCSTVAPSYARRAAVAFAAKGAHFLDTPVTGSKPEPRAATSPL